MSLLPICTSTDGDFEERLRALERRSAELPGTVEAAARAVIAEVRAGGDQAVRAATQRFEGRSLAALELSRAEWEAAAATVAAPVQQALERAAARIRAFHGGERHPGCGSVAAGV